MVARSRTWTLSLVLASGCTTWVTHPVGPDSARLWGQGSVRVTRVDRTVLTLSAVEIGRDSLVGMTTGDSPNRVALPIAEVQSIQTRETSAQRTIGLVAAIIALDVLGSAAFCSCRSK